MEISIRIDEFSEICGNHWIHMSWIHMSRILQDFVVKCPTTGLACRGTCHKQPAVGKIVIPLPFPSISGAEWYQPTTLSDLFQHMALLEGKKVFYVAGHTSVGVYNDGPYDAAVDTKKVADLFLKNKSATNVVLGANITLTDIVDFFKDASQSPPFRYLDVLADHIRRIAGTPVRNVSVNIFLFSCIHLFCSVLSDLLFYCFTMDFFIHLNLTFFVIFYLILHSAVSLFIFARFLSHLSTFFSIVSFNILFHFFHRFSFFFLHSICYFEFLFLNYFIEFLHSSFFFPSFSFLFCPIFVRLSSFIRFAFWFSIMAFFYFLYAFLVWCVFSRQRGQAVWCKFLFSGNIQFLTHSGNIFVPFFRFQAQAFAPGVSVGCLFVLWSGTSADCDW